MTERIVFVKTPMHSKSCGFPFEEGEEYLVYGGKYSLKSNKPSDDISVNKCGRTRKLSDAQEDLSVLANISAKDPMQRTLSQDIESPWGKKAPSPYENQDNMLVKNSYDEKWAESSTQEHPEAIQRAKEVLSEWGQNPERYEYNDNSYDYKILISESPNFISIVFTPIGLEGLERHVEIRMTKNDYVILSILPGS